MTESSFGAGDFTTYDRDALTGQLDGFTFTSINPFLPAELAIEPDGSHFFGAGSDRIVSFDTDDDSAGFHDVSAEYPVLQDGVAGVASIPFVVDLAMAPDCRHLYATSNDTAKTIAIFATPAYDFLEVNDEGGSAAALDGASSIAVSPDGENAYATATAEDAIQVFSRNPATGALNAVHVARDGIGIVTGLDGARSVIVSPDGKNVYAAGSIADAVVAFTRNANGQIVFLEKEQNGVGGVAELNNPFALAITRDGKNVYVASSLNYSVQIFARDTATGTLSAGGHFVDGEGGVDGLFLAESIAVSPDGRNVYVGGKGDNEIAIFSRDLNIGTLRRV
jgi:6-phosphogluconolactonase (cycloisomerase 2 family)